MTWTTDDIGAFAFGLIIGWYVYYVNRYRKGEVQFSDITTLVGIIGGGLAVKGTALSFGWYGIGLAVGFFGYFLVLVVLVSKSDNFDPDWFLDGRRKNPDGEHGFGEDAGKTIRPMQERIALNRAETSPVPTQVFYVGTPAPVISTVNKIQTACARLLPANTADCSAFAKAVCAEFSVGLSGQANDIVQQLTIANGWTVLGNDSGAGKRAGDAAAQNLLVIGAKAGTPNGHVVVVVPGKLERDKYPHAYWGKLNDPDNAGYDSTVNWAWNSFERDSVTYAARPV